MNINKAIKKQKKSYRMFMLIMCFIFLMNPLILFAYGIHVNVFFRAYSIILEILIACAMFIKINKERLVFEIHNNRLVISSGIIRRKYLIICDKVAMVHTENIGEDEFMLIIIMSVKFRNKRVKAIGKKFLRKYPYLGDRYIKLKKKNPEKLFYYMVINRGVYKKYILLDVLYRNCLKAVFTSEAIENIKKLRCS